MRDHRRRRIAIRQPHLEAVTGCNFAAAGSERARQETRVVADDQQFPGVGRRIFSQMLRDGVRRQLDIPKRKCIADNPPPTRCAKLDD